MRLQTVSTALLFFLLGAIRAGATGIVKGPYLQNPTLDSMTICWVSDSDCTGVVSCQAGTEKPVEVKERTKTKYHRVKVEKLKPATYYKYSVRCEGSTGEGSFRTAVPPGRTFRFVAYGDNRSQPQIHISVLKAISAFKPDFVLQTGDMVPNGENQEQWDEYWQVAGPTLGSIPIFPALGNHEKNGAPYFRYFDVQRDYSFDYGDVHFVALDSNRPPSEVPMQMEWLRKDLAAHQDAAWRIVYMHHTIHTCTDMPARRNESAMRRKLMEPILQEGNVQLFISGHDHNYQRHVEGGITYIVSGGGGAPLYNLTPNTIYVVAAKKAHHHCEIIADAKRLDFRSVEPDGTVIDKFDLKRE